MLSLVGLLIGSSLCSRSSGRACSPLLVSVFPVMEELLSFGTVDCVEPAVGLLVGPVKGDPMRLVVLPWLGKNHYCPAWDESNRAKSLEPQSLQDDLTSRGYVSRFAISGGMTGA